MRRSRSERIRSERHQRSNLIGEGGCTVLDSWCGGVTGGGPSGEVGGVGRARLRGRPPGLGVAVAFVFASGFSFAFAVLALTFALAFAAARLATLAIV